MNIRHAMTPLDVTAAFQIETQCYPPEAAATLAAFQFRQQAFGRYFFVLEIGSAIAGVANGVKLQQPDLADESIKQAAAHSGDGAYFCILTIAVHPAERGKGYGSQLLQAVIRQAREERMKGIVLMCEQTLIAFYEREGFVYIRPSASAHGGVQWHEMLLELDA